MAQAHSQQDNCAPLAQTLVHPDTCCQKGAMASTKRKADEPAQKEEQSSKDRQKEEYALKNNLVTYFRRQVGGHMVKTPDDDMNILKKCQGAYHGMGAAQKLEFAQAFKANKSTGTFQWMKEYTGAW